ncbi:MAG: hypothetical protein KJZ96_13840 [Rhodocyclaceae bacterium]|nr:hypothetical protein [Rhodocyclaceae bacterium]
MRNHIILGAVLLSLTSMASAVEKIGVIDVTVDGQQSQWQTIRHANSDGVDASARVYRIGPMTSLEIQGQGEGTFSMEVLFPGAARPDARPAGVDIILFPKGERITGTRWTSEDAGVAPTVTFDVLKIGEAFPLLCPICHAEMRIIAFINEAPTVKKILEHIGESSQPPRIAPARGPPLWEAAAAEQAGNDPQWDQAAQPAPDFEFDQRIAW